MKKTLIAVALTTSFGATACQPASALTPDNCKSIEGAAAAIMEMRQEGRPMSSLIAAMGKEGNPVREIYIAMVRDAYGQPRYLTPENQQRAVEDFRNDIYAYCYQEVTE